MSPAREPDDADDADDADGLDARLSSLAGLGEPVRRALYRYVVAAPEPVSRDAAASGTGVARHVAKFHLDKLAADGLLEVEYRRPPGRTGPGAGRPTKLYRRSAREISVSLPARQYDLAGRVMAEAITSASRTGVPPADALHRVARDAGRALGDDARRMLGARRSRAAAIRAIADVLDANGFEPRVDAGGITLANCPFHSLSRQYTDLVCGMNLDLITGLVGSVEQSALSATLAPGPDRCCVTLTRSEADA